MSPVLSGFGGAPVGDDEDVADLILRTTTVPYLPAEAASSLVGWLEGTPRPLTALDRRILDGCPTGGRVVTSVPGPVTLAMAARAAAHPAYRSQVAVDALCRWISARTEEVAAIRPDLTMTVLLDEPALSVFAQDDPDLEHHRVAAIETLAAVVGACETPLIIRCDEDTDWSIVAAVTPAGVCWNVSELGDRFESHLDTVAAAIGRGMRVVWGVASAEPSPTGSDLVTVTRYRTNLAKLVVAGAPLEMTRDEAWFVPNASVEHLDTTAAARVMARVAEVVAEVT